jgi:hypothetical protein
MGPLGGWPSTTVLQNVPTEWADMPAGASANTFTPNAVLSSAELGQNNTAFVPFEDGFLSERRQHAQFDETIDEPVGIQKAIADGLNHDRAVNESLSGIRLTLGRSEDLASREPQLMNSTADRLRLHDARSHAESRAYERKLRVDSTQLQGWDYMLQSAGFNFDGAEAATLLARELTRGESSSAEASASVSASALPFGSLFADFGELGRHGGRTVDSNPLRSTLDRDDGSQVLDRTGSNGDASSLIQQGVAAAVDELERLRSTVRAVINDLERVRGPVQPSLPALPVNRGTFRIS